MGDTWVSVPRQLGDDWMLVTLVARQLGVSTFHAERLQRETFNAVTPPTPNPHPHPDPHMKKDVTKVGIDCCEPRSCRRQVSLPKGVSVVENAWT